MHVGFKTSRPHLKHEVRRYGVVDTPQQAHDQTASQTDASCVIYRRFVIDVHSDLRSHPIVSLRSYEQTACTASFNAMRYNSGSAARTARRAAIVHVIANEV